VRENRLASNWERRYRMHPPHRIGLCIEGAFLSGHVLVGTCAIAALDHYIRETPAEIEARRATSAFRAPSK